MARVSDHYVSSGWRAKRDSDRRFAPRRSTAHGRESLGPSVALAHGTRSASLVALILPQYPLLDTERASSAPHRDGACAGPPAPAPNVRGRATLDDRRLARTALRWCREALPLRPAAPRPPKAAGHRGWSGPNAASVA